MSLLSTLCEDLLHKKHHNIWKTRYNLWSWIHCKRLTSSTMLSPTEFKRNRGEPTLFYLFNILQTWYSEVRYHWVSKTDFKKGTFPTEIERHGRRCHCLLILELSLPIFDAWSYSALQSTLVWQLPGLHCIPWSGQQKDFASRSFILQVSGF